MNKYAELGKKFQVERLHAMTNVGMMDCQRMLIKYEWDDDKALGAILIDEHLKHTI